MHRAPRPFPISSIAAFAGLALAIPAPVEGASREYTVHLQPSKFTLYTDPYTSEEILLGGFSGLYPAPGGHDRYYVVTDRGPAPDFVDQNGIGYKTWAVPEFGPHIVTVDLQPNGKAMVRDVRPLTRPDGTAITGLPTSLPFTDAPYDFDLNPLPLDEDSLDAEGITLDGRGYFWICEEYKPSVAKVAPDGRVLLRLVPAGTRTGIETVPTLDVLPAVLAKRRNNRGFEGIAASTDGMLYAILQRPLNNPNRAAADANGNGRIVAIDLNALETGQTVIRQYLYPMPPANGSVTVSDLFSTAPGKLLATERGTDVLYEIDLTEATDLSPLELANGRLVSDPSRTLEQLNAAGLLALGVRPVAKSVVLSGLTSISPLLEKVEGVCVSGGRCVFTYDNDFNVAEAASLPQAPLPGGPRVQLELVGDLQPKLFVVPR